MSMLASAHSRLWLALAVSTLVHAGLLTMMVQVLPLRLVVSTKPLLAVIKVPNRVLPAGAAVPVPASTHAPARLKTAPMPISGRRVRSELAVRDVGTAALASPANANTERLSPSESEVAPVPVPVPSGASTVLREGASADDLRQYRVALAIAARRFKRYPLVARERGWEGRVEVAVNVSAWQPSPQLSLIRSSGRALLDEQALSMIEQAAAATTLPDSLRGRDFRVLLPIEFTLSDEH
ncbi:TonB family protein [Candidatus Accumulibacter contiguus]|uniref:TonB family protein n=2 Tax=Candidatus Accumulibacter contiguus TaxID=2954381 RepID=A0ABX1TF41_9PROT|nr:TonB family protein [Candidatus Accumulibacter contiguus]